MRALGIFRGLTAFLLLISYSLGATAQDATQRLVVWQKSGEKTFFDLSEEPVTTFEDGKLVIKTSKMTVELLLKDILRYTHEGEMTLIEQPALKPGELRYSQGEDQMRFEGLPAGTCITVCSSDGKQLSTQTAQQGKPVAISFVGYPAGTYIVKINDTTFKFLKR